MPAPRGTSRSSGARRGEQNAATGTTVHRSVPRELFARGQSGVRGASAALTAARRAAGPGVAGSRPRRAKLDPVPAKSSRASASAPTSLNVQVG